MKFSFAGLIGAAFAAALSVAPSLIPRSSLIQGLIGGVLAAIGYGIGALVGWLLRRARHQPDWRSDERARAVALLLGSATVTVALLAGRWWQADLAQITGVPSPGSIWVGIAGLVGLGVFILMVLASRAVRWLVRRFDRGRKGKKFAVEDFAQLLGKTRDTKYDSSMEQVAKTLDYCTFPIVEGRELFRRTVFCFLAGNEDMHLKNFSLLTRDGKTTLSPAYDLLSSSLVLSNPEELALPLAGKRRNLTKNDLRRYFGRERLGLTEKTIDAVFADVAGALPAWKELIERSFLSDTMKSAYRELLRERLERAGLPAL